MIKTARQMKDLIRNLTREKSADAQILMRNYMMERFLERISLSEYRDNFILKGGIRVSMATVFDGVVTPLKIDISTGDAITPKAAPKARRSVASLTMYPTRKKQITAGSSPALRVTAG